MTVRILVVSAKSKRIAARIWVRRRATGMSQRQLAARLGWSVSLLSAFENGEREIYLSDLQPIAEQLGRSVAWFERDWFERKLNGHSGS